MSIYKSAVNKPITSIMVFVAVLIIGLYSLNKLPVDLYPEINPPFISVMTTYPGANALDIENNITKPLENSLNSVDKLKEITSSSNDNMSIITLEFQWEANLDEATNNIRDVIDRTYDILPDGVDRPTIFKFNTNMFPILFFAITAEENYPGLKQILEEKIVNPLNRIDGIGTVGIAGAPVRVVYVDIDPQKLDAYNLSIEQIGGVIAKENVNMPSGNIKMGENDYQLRVQGEFKNSNRLSNLVVGNFNGKVIYLKDVANIEDRIKDMTIEEKINGKEGVRLIIMKQSGANTVSVARDVMKSINNLQKNLPPDIKINLIFDSSKFIKHSISNLSQTIMWALLFVILVVLFFLGRWRATLIIALTIPLSLIAAFIYLFITGNSINIISLSAISIAIGMVVDDAIVVLENITRHIERGSSPREAAIYATNEVWQSVLITTLVIVAVFMPLTLVSGMTGVMFKQLGWIVSITVVTSTVAAITLTPMLSSKLLKLKEKEKNSFAKQFYTKTIDKFLQKIELLYEKTLTWTLKHKKLVLIASLLIFIFSLFLSKNLGTDFLPESDESRLNITVELQTGTRVEETLKTAKKIEKIIADNYPEKILISTSAGSDEEGGIMSLFNENGSNIINLTVRLTDINQRQRTVWDIADDLRMRLKQFPEIINSSIQTSDGGFGGENAVDIEIFGYDFNSTNTLAEKIKQRVNNIKGAVDVSISRKKDKPELQIVLNREKMALHGLNTATVSMYLRNRIKGMTASKYKENGEEYDIIVRFAEKYRQSIDDLRNITILTPQGKKIKLTEIADIQEYWSPPNIEHKRKERQVTVKAKASGIPLGTLAEKIKTEIADINIPQGIIVNVGGTYEDQQESFQDLALLMLISLLLVFIVMASQFESFKTPFVIMFSIPFAFSGVIFALLITGKTLGMISALGAILLIGIVVKNGIVLVDYINLMRDRNLPLNEAIIKSGNSRLRPVLMTAFTTILGMLPMALSTGEGSEIWQPMGIAVIGGLMFSTVITMIIVPVMYGIIAKSGERGKKEKIRQKFKFLD